MIITWDEIKRQANLEKHGLDFVSLEESFFATAVILPAKHDRFKAIGRMKDGTIAVVFAMRGTEAISVISMRPASKSERELMNHETSD